MFRKFIRAGFMAVIGMTMAHSINAGEFAAPDAAMRRPNILMILIDDLGYTDLGAYGGNIATPNIDRLAMNGLRFTNVHVYPSCAPTRSALITGKDPHQVGLGSQNGLAPPGVSTSTPGYKGSLEGEFVGIAEILSEAGYNTYHAGKWHLGHEAHQTPAALGFAHSFALMDGAASHYADMLGVSTLVSPGGEAMYRHDDQPVKRLPDNFYSTQYYTQQMIDMIEAGRENGKPFFGYLAYTAVHDPLHAPEDIILKYMKLLDDGFRRLKDARTVALAKEGLVADPNQVSRWLSSTPDWSDLDEAQKRDMSKRMAVYAAMLDYLDQEVGRLIAYLRKTGQYENTLIVVMSDNGAATVPRTVYAVTPEQKQWQGEHYPLTKVDDYGKPGSFATLGTYNAEAVSGPYFGFKTNMFEGGTRVPMIVKLPFGNAAEKRDAFVHIVDLYPTFADYAGTSVGEANNILGCSIRAVFEGENAHRCTTEFGSEYMGWRAFQEGDWKLIFVSEPFGGNGRYALYDLSADPGETHDLAEQYPQRVSEMAAKWLAYAQNHGVQVVPMEAVNARYETMARRLLDIQWGD